MITKIVYTFFGLILKVIIVMLIVTFAMTMWCQRSLLNTTDKQMTPNDLSMTTTIIR